MGLETRRALGVNDAWDLGCFVSHMHILGKVAEVVAAGGVADLSLIEGESTGWSYGWVACGFPVRGLKLSGSDLLADLWVVIIVNEGAFCGQFFTDNGAKLLKKVEVIWGRGRGYRGRS